MRPQTRGKLIQNAKRKTQTFLSSKFVRDTLTLQAGKIVLTGINVLASMIVVRGLGDTGNGQYALVLTMYGLLMTLNLTGLDASTVTRLSEAVGMKNRAETCHLMAFYVQMSLLVAVVFCSIAFAAGPTLAAASYGDARIGEWMRLYALSLFVEPLYSLSLITLQSTHAMRAYAALENGGMLLEAGLLTFAIVAGGGVTGVILARLAGVTLRASIGVWAYRRLQARRPEALPTVRDVLRAARTQSPRPYWRFGMLLALDKNLSILYTLLPIQLLGMWAGEEQAGFLKLALGALSYPALLFAGVLTNLEARLPADAGRKDYVRLEDNFRRVARWIGPLSVGIFGAFALAAPVLLWLLYGDEFIPAIPLAIILSIYGMVTGVGGIFAPVYRTLRLAREMIAVKLAALLIVAPLGVWLIREHGAVGGAWAINLIYLLSVGLTAAVVWPRLRRLAREQRAKSA